MYNLYRKKVFITGVAAGLGFDLCINLLGRGAIIYGVDKDPISISGSRFFGIQADLTREVVEYDDICFDILILNAANNPGVKPFKAYALEEIETALELNIFTQVRILKTLRYKKVVFISSVCAFTGLPNFSIYSATKAFLSTLAESLRREGTETYVIHPYKLDTKMFSEMRDFCTLNTSRVAKLILDDIERNVKQRTIPRVFSLTKFAAKFIPQVIFDFMLIVIERLFRKEALKE